MTRFASVKIGVLVMGLMLLHADRSAAQSFQGGLRGAVRDANGVIPSVDVTLINEGTNISRTTITNAVGEYVFAAVLPGTYTVRAVLQGFKTFERRGLTIGTQQFITLDLMMEPGTVQEEITITGDAPLIETSNASTGEVLNNETLEALPALNRNAFMTVATVPTVLAQGNPYFSRLEDQSNGSLLSLGGGPLRANNYLLDGVSVTDLQNRASVFVSTDAIDEVKVQVHTYDAEMGRSGGGVFNTTGRSGSNAFRGNAFFQVRPNWAAEKNFFDERAGRPKPTDTYYRYWGGSFGGPVQRDRTFFWATHEGYRTNSGLTGLLYLPTDRELAGDFSQSFDRSGNLVVIYDPVTTRQMPNGQFTRDPFPGNVIPSNRISRVARNIAGYLPKPDEQRSAADGLGNKQVTVPAATEAEQYVFKGEHKLTSKASLTGLYLYQNTDEGWEHFWEEHSPFADPGHGAEVRRVHVVALNHFLVPTTNTVVSLRYGWTRFDDNQLPYSGFDLADLGFPASFVSGVTFEKFPNGTIEGYPNARGYFGNRAVSRNRYKSWAANGSVSTLFGRQTIKYGADFRQIGVDALDIGRSSGDFNFSKSWTQADPFRARTDQGSGFATFLLGIPTGTTPVSRPLDAFTRYYAAYVQDDFRVTSGLTLNVGVRYEYETGMREAENRFTVAFDQDAVSPLAARTGLNLRGGLRYAGQDGFPEHQGDPSTTKFSPRVGFAWTLDDRTVVRGGYGLFWSPWVYTGPGTANYGQIGYTQSNEVFHSSDLIPTVTLDNPYPNGLAQPSGNSLGLLTGVGGPIDYVWQDRKSPYVQQYSADLQRELPGDMAASIGYVGARGDDLGYGGASADIVNINTLTREQMALGPALQQQVPNPFFGIPEAGPFSRRATLPLGQLLRPFPQFEDIRQRQTSGARTRYHAIVAQLNKRMSRGIGGRFHYTWSRLDDDQFGQGNHFSGANQGGRPLDSRNLAAEYSRSLRDVPHRVVLSPIVELPFGEGRRWATAGLANALGGGWTFSGIFTYESGSPINIVQADNTGSFGGIQRPHWTAIDPTTEGDTLDRLNNWIDPAAYELAAPFTFGTAPRTDPRNRTHFRTNYDIVLAKNVSLEGSARLQFRIEMLNATNNPKFQGPEARVGVATLGAITMQSGFSRTTQFMIRFNW
jgi:trimeric autotransporter adhesin